MRIQSFANLPARSFAFEPRIEVHDGDTGMPAHVIEVIHPTPFDPAERAETTACVEAPEALERFTIKAFGSLTAQKVYFQFRTT